MMNKKKLLYFLLAFIILFLFGCRKQEKIFRVSDYYCHLLVKDNGNIIVTEEMVYEFQSGKFSHVTREIDDEYTDGFEYISSIATDENGVEIVKEADHSLQDGKLSVTWNFPEVSSTSIRFMMKFAVHGVCYTDTLQIIRWRAVPEMHDFLIEKAAIDMELPVNPATVSFFDSGRQTVITDKTGKVVSWQAENILSDESFVCKIGLPNGTLNFEEPEWKQIEETIAAYSPTFIALAVAAGLILLILLIYMIIYSIRLKKQFTPADLPSDLFSMHPALVAKLLDGFEGNSLPAAPLFFNLLKNGSVTLEKESKSKYNFRTTEIVPENEFEKELYEILLLQETKGKVDVKTFFRSRTRSKKNLCKKMNDWHLQNDYVNLAGKKRQGWWLAALLFAMFAAFGFFIAGIVMFEQGKIWSIITAFLFFLIGVYAAVALSRTRSYTPEGYTQKFAWQKWSKDFSRKMKKKELETSQIHFDLLFPYSLVLGLAEKFIKYCKDADIDLEESILLQQFEDLETLNTFLIWFVAVNAATGSSGAAAAGGASAGGGSASAG